MHFFIGILYLHLFLTSNGPKLPIPIVEQLRLSCNLSSFSGGGSE